MQQSDEKINRPGWSRWAMIIIIGLVLGFEVKVLLDAWSANSASAVEQEDNWDFNEGNAIKANLREIALAAQKYMKDKGVDQVSVHELVGNSGQAYIRSITPVHEEKYNDIVVTRETKYISLQIPDGHFVAYRLTPSEATAPGPTSSAR